MSGDVRGDGSGFMVSFAAGSRIADYRLEEQIGRGGMAVVFRAREERLGRLVALKILIPALAGNAEFQRRFISESRAAAAIDDPHIVPVFAAGEADGVLFIAMRYVAGGDARSLLLREGPMPPGRVAAIISPTASALDAAHRTGLLHRDVKPSNMLMDLLPGRPDHVYLSDFGISKATTSTSGMTRTGMIMGTPDYISPEQIEGTAVDGRADQYALACSAFELLTGGPPFHRDGSEALLQAHLADEPPRPTSRRAGLPGAVDDVLSKALAKSPEGRYASCGQFADALRAAFGFPPYDASLSAVRPATHPLTEFAWPSDRVSTPDISQQDTVTRLRADLNAATRPGPPVLPGSTPSRGDGAPTDPLDDADAPPPRRPRRRIAMAALAAVIIMAAAGLTAGLLTAGNPGPAAAGPTPGPVTAPVPVPISVKSAEAALGGDVYVVYHDGSAANAEVYGKIGKTTSGEVAALYAQQFPYHQAPARVGTVVLQPSGATASYQFQVTPVLATRYQVKLFKSSTAPAPLGTSASANIYVDTGAAVPATYQACARPLCTQSLTIKVLVPPSSLPVELTKESYLYFGVNLSATKAPAYPQTLTLGAGNARATGWQRVSADEMSTRVTFSFQIGNDGYTWNWNMCTMDTEAADGIGLPGHHGCGDQHIPASAAYLG